MVKPPINVAIPVAGAHGFSQGAVLRSLPHLARAMTLDPIEEAGFGHDAHGFVRGNWRNGRESTFMLMAESCHDLDCLAWLVGPGARSDGCAGVARHPPLVFAAEKCGTRVVPWTSLTSTVEPTAPTNSHPSEI